MPEGPEVLETANRLNGILQGRHILSFDFITGRYHRSPPLGFDGVRLPCLVNKISCYGKFIYWELENKTYIWNTLGMSGGWGDNSTGQNSDTRAIVKYDNGEGLIYPLYYNDRRNFGTFHFNKNRRETEEKIEKLGHDPLYYLTNGFTEKDLGVKALSIFALKRNKKKTLAEILMAQDNWAGIGNYLKAEILYRAKLSPHRLGESLDGNEIIILDNCVRNTIIQAYKAKGSYGGSFQKVIYKRSHCPLGHEIKVDATKDGRNTWYCEIEQK